MGRWSPRAPCRRDPGGSTLRAHLHGAKRAWLAVARKFLKGLPALLGATSPSSDAAIANTDCCPVDRAATAERESLRSEASTAFGRANSGSTPARGAAEFVASSAQSVAQALDRNRDVLVSNLGSSREIPVVADRRGRSQFTVNMDLERDFDCLMVGVKDAAHPLGGIASMSSAVSPTLHHRNRS